MGRLVTKPHGFRLEDYRELTPSEAEKICNKQYAFRVKTNGVTSRFCSDFWIMFNIRMVHEFYQVLDNLPEPVPASCILVEKKDVRFPRYVPNPATYTIWFFEQYTKKFNVPVCINDGSLIDWNC